MLNICSGGFLLDAEFTPQRLSELAKMDGAIILASDGTRVARANVHLVPDPDIPTTETGTRHRTAERVARQIDVPVFTVSEEMGVVSVHYRGHKRTLVAIPRVLARADQALQILGRYKARLDGVTGALSALEVEDLVTLRDVVTVLQRAEMVRRIADEIEGYVVELGDDGRLVALQLEELTGGVDDDRRLVGTRLLRRVGAPDARRRDHPARRALRRGPARPARSSPRCSASRPRWTSTRRCSRAATACSTGSRACPRRSPTT